MVSEGEAGGARYEVYSTVVKLFVATLRERNWFAAVRERVAPEVRALIDAPPVAAWTDGMHLEAVCVALEALHGAAAVRELNRLAVRNSLPFTRGASIVQGLLRLFGPAPDAFFARMDTYTARTVRGVRYTYTPISRNAGSMEVEYPSRSDVPLIAFVGAAGSGEGVIDLLGRTGRASDPELLARPRRNAARYRVEWT